MNCSSQEEMKRDREREHKKKNKQKNSQNVLVERFTLVVMIRYPRARV